MKRLRVRATWTEKDEERACDKAVLKLGGAVVRLSQPRRSGVTLGLPDRRYRVMGVAFWFEVKTPSGKLTHEQLGFLEAEAACGSIASCGGLVELARLLETIGRAQHGGVFAVVAPIRDDAAKQVARDQREAMVKRGLR